MLRSRVIPFKEEHQLEYGLEVASSNPTTKEVDSVRCKFCIAFGKEGASTAARKQKVTDNMKYFTRPFRPDNYKSHLKTHSEKWAEYQALNDQENRVFFDLKAARRTIWKLYNNSTVICCQYTDQRIVYMMP